VSVSCGIKGVNPGSREIQINPVGFYVCRV
jgi:hypothetical protein